MNLYLDIIKLIAACDPITWYHMTIASPEFAEYAISYCGRIHFTELFTVRTTIPIDQTWTGSGAVIELMGQP